MLKPFRVDEIRLRQLPHTRFRFAKGKARGKSAADIGRIEQASDPEGTKIESIKAGTQGHGGHYVGRVAQNQEEGLDTSYLKIYLKYQS